MALKITVIGTGYLGATHAAAMAELGFEVMGLDVVPEKIDKLRRGEVPMYEPGLEELLRLSTWPGSRARPVGCGSPWTGPSWASSATSISSA